MPINDRIDFNNLWDDIFDGVTADVVTSPLVSTFGLASVAGAIGSVYRTVIDN